MHRVAAISSGALAMLPHNGAVVTLLAICGATQRGSYREIMMVGLVGPLIALVLLSRWGSYSGHFDAVRPTTGVSGADFRAGSRWGADQVGERRDCWTAR